jgi:hypothetical protein
MNEFFIYLQLGYQHITDINGYDHILFVIAICGTDSFSDWKKVLFLVTAFTIGHSVTLAMAALKLFEYSSNLIEFLIPVTIMLTCIFNFSQRGDGGIFTPKKIPTIRYFFALVFGLIHGMGFSNYLKSLLGKDESIVMQLLAFNMGLEIGQLLIVIFAMLFSFLVLDAFKVKKYTWNLILSAFLAGIAFKLMTEKWYF